MDSKLTESQLNRITGHMLGDGMLEKVLNSKWNSHFSFKQCIQHEEYVLNAQLAFSDFNGKLSYETVPGVLNKPGLGIIGKDYSKSFYSVRFRTKCHEEFTKLEKKWYLRNSDGNYAYNKQGRRIKIVPADIPMNWEVLSYWYMDDGTNNPRKKAIRISTNGFQVSEVKFLSEKLKSSLNLTFTIHIDKLGHPTLNISQKDYLAFISGIHPFICKIQCFSRKLSIENAGVINKDKYDPITLKQEQIAFIVDAYNKKSMLCKDLAQKFSISRTTIHRIVRSKNNNPNSKLKTKRKFTKDNIIQVINLWNEGNSARKIAKITGMDRSGISRIVNRKQCLETTQNLYIRK